MANYFDAFDPPANPNLVPVDIEGEKFLYPPVDLAAPLPLAPAPATPLKPAFASGPNFFDQFDSPPAAPKAAAPNFFDQFDTAAPSPEPPLPQPEKPPGYLDVIKAAFLRGLQSNLSAAKSGLAAAGQKIKGETVAPPPVEQPQDALSAFTTAPYDFHLGMPNLKKILGKTIYGLTDSAPELGGAVAGGVAGTAVGGGPESPAALVTAPLGTGLGAYGAHIIKSAAPVFAEELQKADGDREAAWNATKLRVKIEGIGTGAAFAAFGINPFENELKNLLFQTLAPQPAIGAAQQTAMNVAEGRPPGEGVLHAAGEAAAATAVPLAADKITRAVVESGRRARIETAQQNAENFQTRPREVQPVPEAVPVTDPAAADPAALRAIRPGPALEEPVAAEPVPAEAPAEAAPRPQEIPQVDLPPESPAAAAPADTPAAPDPALKPAPKPPETEPPVPAPPADKVEPPPAAEPVVADPVPGEAPAEKTPAAQTEGPPAAVPDAPAKEPQYSNFLDHSAVTHLKYLDEEAVKTYQKDGSVDRNTARILESDAVLSEIEEKAREYGVPDITRRLDRAYENNRVVKDLQSRGRSLKKQAESFARFYSEATRAGARESAAAEIKTRYEQLHKTVTSAQDYLDALSAPAGEAQARPEKKARAVQAQAAKDESLRQLRLIRETARAQIKAGAAQYTGPREAVLETARGRKTQYKTSADTPRAVLSQVDNAIRNYEATPRDLSYARLPDYAQMPAERADTTPAPDIAASKPPKPAPIPAPAKSGPETRLPPGNEGKAGAPFKQRLISLRRGIWKEIGIDPALGENMPSLKQLDLFKTHFKNKFNIDVEVQEKADMAAALNNLKDYNAELQTLAYIQGVPNSAIGLRGAKLTPDGLPARGNLKLVFKPEREGGHLGAHVIDPITREAEIWIPGRARSLAHEYAHWLDYAVLDAMGKTKDSLDQYFRGYTARVRRAGVDYTPASVSEAFIDVMNSIYFDDSFKAMKIMDLEVKTGRGKISRADADRQIEAVKSGNFRGMDWRSPYYRDAKSLPAGSDQGYFSRPTEMFARAHEAWVSYKAEGLGVDLDLLAARPDVYKGESGENIFDKMYPQGPDRDRIFRAMDQLMGTLSKAEIAGTGKVDPAVLPGGEEMVDPMRWFRHMDGYKEPEKNMMEAVFGTKEERRDNMRRSRQMLGILQDGRPKTPQTGLRALNNIMMMTFSAEMRQMRVIESRYKSKPSPALRQAIDAVYNKPGSGEYTGTRFGREEYNFQARYQNRQKKIDTLLNLRRYDKEQMAALRDLLLGHAQDVPKALQAERASLFKAAEGYREIWNEAQAEGREAGVDAGFLKDEESAYINRIPDIAKISGRRDKAIAAFTEAYADKYRQEIEAGEIDAKDISNVAETAEAQARALVNDYMIGDDYERNFTPPAAAFTKRRSFPGSADRILKDFYIDNPVEALETYLRNMGSRTAYSKLFDGENGGFKKLFERMADEGVDQGDIKTVRKLILSAVGKSNRLGVLSHSGNILMTLNRLFTATMLSKVVFASIPELGTAGMRTGKAGDSFRTWGLAFKEKWDKADSRDRDDALQAWGIIKDNMVELSMVDRLGGTYGNQQNTGLFDQQYYKASLVEPLTNFQRKVAVRLGQVYFLRMANSILNAGEKPGNRSAALAEFRDMGLSEAQIKPFAEWLHAREGALPDKEQAYYADASTDRPHAEQYAKMLSEFTWDVISRPENVHRSYAANTYGGNIIFGFLSVTSRFYETMIKRQARATARVYKERGAAAAGAYAAKALALPWLSYYAMATGAFYVKTLLLNNQSFQRKTDDEKARYIALGGAAYSMPGGPGADILFNQFARSKYDKSLASAFEGKGGYIFDAIQPFIDYFDPEKNSPNSDYGERKLLQGAYRILAMPAMALATGVMPYEGLPLTTMGLANMWLGSSDAQQLLGNAVFGAPDPGKSYRKTKSGASAQQMRGGGTRESEGAVRGADGMRAP